LKTKKDLSFIGLFFALKYWL